MRAKVEHAFQVVKVRFGHAKTRYRGLAKNANMLCVAFALANLAMCVSAGHPLAPAGARA